VRLGCGGPSLFFTSVSFKAWPVLEFPLVTHSPRAETQAVGTPRASDSPPAENVRGFIAAHPCAAGSLCCGEFLLGLTGGSPPMVGSGRSMIWDPEGPFIRERTKVPPPGSGGAAWVRVRLTKLAGLS